MTSCPWGPIADDLARRGWSWGATRAVIDGRLLWVADAHRDDGHRYVAQAGDGQAGVVAKRIERFVAEQFLDVVDT